MLDKFGVVPGEEEEPEDGPSTATMLDREIKARRKRALKPGKPGEPGPTVYPGFSNPKGVTYKS